MSFLSRLAQALPRATAASLRDKSLQDRIKRYRSTMPRIVKKRARSSRPFKRAVGVTKKFRSASVFKKKPGKRVLRGSKRSTKRNAGFSKTRFAAKVAGVLMGDKTSLYALQDRVEIIGTTNAAAIQQMWSSLQTVAQLGTTFVGNFTALQTHNPQVMIDAMYTNTAGKVVAGGGSLDGLLPFQKLLCKSYKVSYKITNAQTSPCEIWEYRCMARNDNTGSSLPDLNLSAIWSDSKNNAHIGGQNALPTNQTVTPVVSTTLGATPFMCNPFVRNYKILKVKKKILMPGKWWQLSYSINKPKVFSWERIMKVTQTQTAAGALATVRIMRGQHFSLFVANGTAAVNAASTAGYRVGLSNVELLIDQRIKMHYAMFQTQQSLSTVGVFQAGFSAADGPTIPLPQIQNQPLYAIGTVTTTNGTVQPMVTAATGPLTITGGVDTPQGVNTANLLTGPVI